MVRRRLRSLVVTAVTAALLLAFLFPSVTAASPASPDEDSPLAPQAALDPPDISIGWTPGSTSVELSWPHVVDTAFYAIYRSTAPYAQMGVAPTNQIDDLPGQAYGQGSIVTYDDAGVDNYPGDGTLTTVQVIGNPQTNYFWVVQGRTASGDPSGASNLVGEFSFAVMKGS
jgi:hypothetical protein